MITNGFFPAPKGPTPPEYPRYNSSSFELSIPTEQTILESAAQSIGYPIPTPYPSPLIIQQTPPPVITPALGHVASYRPKRDISPTPNLYQEKLKKYDEANKTYKAEQKIFKQNKVVPYAQGILMGWIIIFTLFSLVGFGFVKIGSPVVGAAYVISGVWAALTLPWHGVMIFTSSQVSTLTRSSGSQELVLTGFYQALAFTCIFSVVVLTVAGIIFMSEKKFFHRNASPNTPSIPPQ